MIALDQAIPLLAATLSTVLPSPAPEAQEPSKQGGQVVAVFQLGGSKRSISRDDVALNLARRHRNSQGGKETIEHLINVLLVEKAARKAGLMPTSEEVRTKIRGYETALRQNKMNLDEVLAGQRMTRSRFTEEMALSIAATRLASKVLKISPDKVTEKHTALWTREARNKVQVETDTRNLAAGVLARVGKFGEVTSLDVGRVLFTKVPKNTLRETINRMVFERCVKHEAARLEIRLSPADLNLQYAKRKKAFEVSGRNQGIPYEQWLEAFGSNKQKELESTALQTTLLHGNLVKRRYPSEFLDQRLAENRDVMLRRHGARRAISTIFIRATTKPNKILRRNFKAALKHIQEIRTAIVGKKKRSFTTMAKIATDDPSTKQSGGKLGWQHGDYIDGAKGRRAPDEVLKAAFSMKVGDVSQPIKTDSGYYLVWMSGIEPEPSKSVIRKRMLSEMADRYNRDLYNAAKIEYKIK
jgi:parvulin-like peptidyl-prolyl isomerase